MDDAVAGCARCSVTRGKGWGCSVGRGSGRKGHQGGYAHYRDAGPLPPESAGPPLVHLEVFTDEAFPAFLAKSRARADALPATSKTVLVIAAGARLVAETPSADGQLEAGVKVKETSDSPRSGRWVRVQACKEIMPADGTTRSPLAGKQGAKTSEPLGDPVWIERGELADTRRVRRSWSRFPLQLSAATEGPVGFGLALTRDSLDRHAALDKAVDEHGVPWWRVTVGTAQGAALRGWVCGKDHPQTSWQSPWAWPLFETVDATDASLLDCFKRILYVTGAVLPEDREDFSHAAAGVKESALVRALEKVIEQQDKCDGRLTAADIKKALRIPWLAQPLSRLVVKYESEWGGSTEKWTKLGTLMKTAPSQNRWQAEVGRIRKLCWWDEVASGKDFSSDPKVYHIHPIGLVGNFITDQEIAWGAKVSPQFKRRVIEISRELGINPGWLMSCMALETVETFSPSIRNPHSTATGLIQFMRATAEAPPLNTTTEALSQMTAVEQLEYVRLYFLPWKGKLKTLEDTYLVIFMPSGIGYDPDAPFLRRGEDAYEVNSGFDENGDGIITTREISSAVHAKYDKGMRDGYRG